MSKSKYLVMPGAVLDERVRKYIPVKRVVSCTDGVKNFECLVDRINVQSFVHFDPEYCILEPGASIILDFGREFHGQLLLTTARMEQMLRVKVTLGESVSECMQTPTSDHAIHQTELDLANMGTTGFGMSAFRFVKVESPVNNKVNINLIGICAVAVYHDWEYVGNFSSSDSRLNKIWETSAYTVHLNCQDYIYDGVKRDRLVWMGDLYPEVRTLLSIFNESALIEKSMDFVRERTGTDQWMNTAPSYSCWWVICQRDLFLYRGDLKYLKSQKNFLKNLLRRLISYVDAKGLEVLPPWRFMDWSTADNEVAKHAGLQGLLSWTLNCGVDLCTVLGEDKLANDCFKTVMKLQQAAAPDCNGNKIAAAMQILGNIGDKKKLNEILASNPAKDISTFYGYFVLLAKAEAGDLKGALSVIRQYWGKMLDFGATTFWEDFDLDWTENSYGIDQLPQPGKKDIHGDFGKHCYIGLRHSLCHGWAGGPAAFLSEKVLGVKPLAPGFSKVVIEPDLGDLDYAEGALPTPHGAIFVKVKRNGNKLDIKAKLPKSVKRLQA